MVTSVYLTLELERFAREFVERGLYSNVSEVVCSGLRLLQETGQRHRGFMSMLQTAEGETDRMGTFTVESVLAEADAIIGCKRAMRAVVAGPALTADHSRDSRG